MYYKTLNYSYQETENELLLNFHLAGKTKENVKVFNQNNTLNIKVDDKNTYTVDFENYLYDVSNYNFDEIKAKMLHGLLSVSLPKKKDKIKNIQIE